MVKLDSIKEPSVAELEIEPEQFPSMNDLSRLQSNIQSVQIEPPEPREPISPKEPPKPISISSGEESEVKVNVNINDMA